MPAIYVCAFVFIVGVAIGSGLAVILWAGCTVSGRHADTEQPIEE